MSRDWHEDKELAHEARNEYKRDYLNPVLDALFYWLEQYRVSQEEIAKINIDYYADKQRFVVQRRELEESKASEKKLREAIETAINEKAAWGDPGNALDVVTRYLADTLASLYPKEETKP